MLVGSFNNSIPVQTFTLCVIVEEFLQPFKSVPFTEYVVEVVGLTVILMPFIPVFQV